MTLINRFKKNGPIPGLILITVGNQNGSFQRKYAFPVPFGGRDGSFQRKLIDEDF